jgi:hypothetical protein
MMMMSAWKPTPLMVRSSVPFPVYDPVASHAVGVGVGVFVRVGVGVLVNVGVDVGFPPLP